MHDETPLEFMYFAPPVIQDSIKSGPKGGTPKTPVFGYFLDLFNYYLFWGKVRLKALTTHSGLFPDPSFWVPGGGGGGGVPPRVHFRGQSRGFKPDGG